MAPRTKEQFEKIRKSSRTEILSAALKLFATNGFHATSISQISEEAGISKGLMYNYFASKDELLRELIKEGFEQLGELMISVHEETNPREALKKIIHLSFSHIKNNATYWKLYMSLILQSVSQKEVEKMMIKVRDESIEELSRLFEAMGDNEPYLKAFALGTQLDGIGLNFVSAPDSFPMDEIDNFLIKTYCSPVNKRKRK
jgi:AcrR family transcriptional regulator